MKRKFKFRCNPVLPEVYDDALSYYEVLGKLTQAINDMEDEIDEGLIDFIKEALPELIADVVYDPVTDTLEFTLVDDVTEEQILNDPISRIAVNGISRPVVDTEARKFFDVSWLKDKNICMYGDSTLVVPETYATHITNSGICNSVTVRGVSGNSLVLQGYNLINSAADLNTFDYVFVCYGINDWSGISRKRYTDAVRATANKIISTGAEPVFVFPWTVYIPSLQSDGFINNYGCDMAGYVDAAIDVCEQLHVKYFNLCELSGVNRNNYQLKLTPSSNGYYLHEGQQLGQYIAKIILNGNYNTGKCKTGDFVGRPFRNFLPLDFSVLTYDAARPLVSQTPTIYRKGTLLSATSGAVRACKAINSGEVCRITGFFKHSETNGYATFGYINEYDQTHTFTPICRIINESDFDFSFTPPNGGGAWRPAFEFSSGSGIFSDLTICSNLGDCRITGSDPATPAASKISLKSTVTNFIQGFEVQHGETMLLSPFGVQAAQTMAAQQTIQIAQLSFYPQHTFYSSCHIGSRTQLVRINATGLIEIYVNQAEIQEGTYIFFDGMDITPTPVFNI